MGTKKKETSTACWLLSLQNGSENNFTSIGLYECVCTDIIELLGE
jgi:hypothetical protein